MSRTFNSIMCEIFVDGLSMLQVKGHTDMVKQLTSILSKETPREQVESSTISMLVKSKNLEELANAMRGTLIESYARLQETKPTLAVDMFMEMSMVLSREFEKEGKEAEHKTDVAAGHKMDVAAEAFNMFQGVHLKNQMKN